MCIIKKGQAFLSDTEDFSSDAKAVQKVTLGCKFMGISLSRITLWNIETQPELNPSAKNLALSHINRLR
jgi:hypothetical protein